MENKKFEVGQFWKDNHGDKHQIMEIHPENINGTLSTYCYGRRDTFILNNEGFEIYLGNTWLTEPWQEPRSGEVSLNIHIVDGDVRYLDDNGSNKMNAHGNAPIARIKVQWKEGQFDE
jgi:hypothetical protein